MPCSAGNSTSIWPGSALLSPIPIRRFGEGSYPGLEMTIRAVALVRLLLPGAHIPATTAAGSIDPQGREKILSSGANVLMPNITPLPYRKDYSLYPGKICLDEDGIKCIGCLELRAGSRGKSIIKDRGDALRVKAC